MTVFLDKGLPGETLRARVLERKARFARAEVLETLSPSPDALPSFCPHGGSCGGCAWTTLAYSAQLAWKERQAKETLARIGKVNFDGESEYLPIIPSPKQTGYRNKMEFAFGLADGGDALGLRHRNAHTIVPVDECALSALPVGPVLAAARAWMRDAGLHPWDGKTGQLRFLVIRCPEYTPDGSPRCLVECITAPLRYENARKVKAFGVSLLESSLATGFVHTTRRDRANVAYGEAVALALGETTVTEAIGRLRLQAPVQAFLQANTGAAALLYEQIRHYAGDEDAVVWDLYCGVGGVALSLFREGLVMRGVESVPEAAAFAAKNAKAVAGDIAFACGDAAEALVRLSPLPDLVITDPPRAGMDKRLTEALLRHKPRRIIAVGCDAASLARDVALLGAAYRLKSARAVDLFPHTPHMEIATLLELAR
jgi:23S rRNA (uracil1939-C5)-methyltransferase